MGLIMIIVTDDGNLDPTRRDPQKGRGAAFSKSRDAQMTAEQEERAGDMIAIRPIFALPR